MPTKREREYYRMGYRDGLLGLPSGSAQEDIKRGKGMLVLSDSYQSTPKRKRKLNSWQKFVKANAKKPRFKSMNNTARFKKLGIAYRKTAAYKRNKKK